MLIPFLYISLPPPTLIPLIPLIILIKAILGLAIKAYNLLNKANNKSLTIIIKEVTNILYAFTKLNTFIKKRKK